MAWKIPDSVIMESELLAAEPQEEATPDEQTPTEGAPEGDTTPPEVSTTLETPDVPDAQEVEQPSPQSEGEPFAELNVYGHMLPVKTKQELIAYAQMGVDYENKMHSIRQWRNYISVLNSNSLVKKVADAAIKGEDISKYVSVDSSGNLCEPQPATVSTEPETPELAFKKFIHETVKQEVEPLVKKPTASSVDYQAALSSLKAEDSEWFDIVYAACIEIYNLPEGAPMAIPSSLRSQVNEDPKAFRIFYKMVRDRVVPYIQSMKEKKANPVVPQAAPQEAPQVVATELTPKRVVRKAPILESARGASPIEQLEAGLEDANAIWDLPTSKFNKLMSEMEQRKYRR